MSSNPFVYILFNKRGHKTTIFTIPNKVVVYIK
jgi:hypothetical protein